MHTYMHTYALFNPVCVSNMTLAWLYNIIAILLITTTSVTKDDQMGLSKR